MKTAQQMLDSAKRRKMLMKINENPKTVNHTPTPWIAGESVISKDKKAILQMECEGLPFKANAAFIVTACNAHEDLIEALTAIKARINGEWDNPALEKQGPQSQSLEVSIQWIVEKALTKAGIK